MFSRDSEKNSKIAKKNQSINLGKVNFAHLFTFYLVLNIFIYSLIAQFIGRFVGPVSVIPGLE